MYTFLNLHSAHKLIAFQALPIIIRCFCFIFCITPNIWVDCLHSMKVLVMLFVTMDSAVIDANKNLW